VTLEHLLDQSHFENKALKEESTSRKSQELIIGPDTDKDDVLPEEAKVPY